MPPKMLWLARVVQLAITPVFLGALFLWIQPARSSRDIVEGGGLALLGVIHTLYWWQPWPAQQRRTIITAAAMVLTNVVLLRGLASSQPLVWLYPALVVGAGLRPSVAAVMVGLLALAAVLPAELDGTHKVHTRGPGDALLLAVVLGPSHAILLAVALAGLGMAAVRQLISLNVDLHAAKAELAELAVAAERERLGRELHDVLGRTLSLIAVKTELAGRLSAGGDASAAGEMRDVQQLARRAIHEVRETVAGGYLPSVAAELAAAPQVLRAAGIVTSIDDTPMQLAPAYEAVIAWTIREAVTNVIRHSGARTCRISLRAVDGITVFEVVDDGRGASRTAIGMGLHGLAQRVNALGGTFEAGASEAGGYRLCVTLDASAASWTPAGGIP